MCRQAVAWVAARDVGRRFEAVPYQEASTPPMTGALRIACARAAHVLTADGRTLRAGRASRFVVGELGYVRTARLLALPPLVWAAELGYWLVARNRRPLSRLLRRR